MFIVLAVILLSLFAFILCGITSFAYGGNFGSVINSVFPIGSGFLVG